MNLKGGLDQAKQSIDVNNNEHLNINLATTFLKPAGEVNPYFLFVYGPQKRFNHTQEQLSGSINAYLIN